MTVIGRLRLMAGRLATALVRLLPERLAVVLVGKYLGYSIADIPQPMTPPTTPQRLLIGPVNFAGQGFHWARAARSIPGVGAISMQYRGADDLGFAVDYEVPTPVFIHSRRFGRELFAAAGGFSHVMIEAERSLLGNRFRGDVRREVKALRIAGVSVSMLVHGSDLRLPSRHREIERWSPFLGEWDDYVRTLEEQALANMRLLADLGAPVLVSTPDMIDYWPAATWLPVAIDLTVWATEAPCLERDRPIVVHAPSRSRIKGTDLIDQAMRDMGAAGLIEYREVTGVPAAEMPEVYRNADIILDQFRLGSYGVAACEAMATGRLVISHVSESVRERAATAAEMPLPILEATGDTIIDVVRGVLDDRMGARRIAARGPEFTARLHGGQHSAQVLAQVCGFAVTSRRSDEGGGGR